MTRAWFASLLACVLASTPAFGQQSESAMARVGDDGVTAPVLIRGMDPTYTPEARAAGVLGFVSVA